MHSTKLPASEPVMEFIRRHFDDEWTRLMREISTLDPALFTFLPGQRIHSIGWHVRHVIEWRYALVHVLICGNKNEENLSCLGWEKDSLIQSLTSVRSWHEPSYTIAETLRFGRTVRDVTDADLVSLPVIRYSETVVFPWRTNRLLDEIFQDLRHSAVHRGQIREIQKVYTRRMTAKWDSVIPEISGVAADLVDSESALS